MDDRDDDLTVEEASTKASDMREVMNEDQRKAADLILDAAVKAADGDDVVKNCFFLQVISV